MSWSPAAAPRVAFERVPSPQSTPPSVAESFGAHDQLVLQCLCSVRAARAQPCAWLAAIPQVLVLESRRASAGTPPFQLNIPQVSCGKSDLRQIPQPVLRDALWDRSDGKSLATPKSPKTQGGLSARSDKHRVMFEICIHAWRARHRGPLKAEEVAKSLCGYNVDCVWG